MSDASWKLCPGRSLFSKTLRFTKGYRCCCKSDRQPSKRTLKSSQAYLDDKVKLIYKPLLHPLS
ncbi:MAG: hypothetical protein RMY28_028120 [Nostoc sp. ChiSLP01]|nr:hypothetical protein [Nostoc sp. CmiSLP01]MDZ8283017.1 hypothetical protein [Nostoc sp. ChiSLP01]